jgi:hypothetical protein
MRGVHERISLHLVAAVLVKKAFTVTACSTSSHYGFHEAGEHVDVPVHALSGHGRLPRICVC